MTEETALNAEYILRINRVIDYVSRRLAANLTLKDLAGVAAFSPFHFHRLFTAFMDETPGEFLTRLRLERSAFRLTYEPTTPVIDVALACGFESPSGFARAFRRRFGMSALAWRKRHVPESNPGQDGRDRSGYLSGRIETIKAERTRRSVAVDIRTIPDYRIAYIRNWGYNRGIRRAWSRLQSWARARDLPGEGAILVGVTHDDDEVTPGDKCRYDACLVVPEGMAPAGEVGVRDLPGGKYAFLGTAGPYRRLWDLIWRAYRDLFRLWLPGSGYQPENRPMLEVYPARFAPGRFSVEIGLPVRPL